MGQTKVSIDGVVRDEQDAVISVFDRGFLYGDSVFEVMRTYGGSRLCGETDHLERLYESARRVLIKMPVSMDVLRKEIATTIEQAGNDESYVRIVVTRGSGPLTYDLSTATQPSRVIVVTPLAVPDPILYEQGVSVSLVRVNRPTDCGTAVGVKASNYLANLLALHEARSRGAYEAIILGSSGAVLEGASSNVFAAHGGVIRTPPPEAGILVGITRQAVERSANALNVNFVETALFPSDLYSADEVFITSSIREVVPVVRVDGKSIANGHPGPITVRLHAEYRKLAQANAL